MHEQAETAAAMMPVNPRHDEVGNDPYSLSRTPIRMKDADSADHRLQSARQRPRRDRTLAARRTGEVISGFDMEFLRVAIGTSRHGL